MGLLVWLLALPGVALAQEGDLYAQLKQLAERAEAGMIAAQENDATAAQAEFDESHEAWETFEDAVRDWNPTAYVELEAAFDGVKEALAATPLDLVAVQSAYDHLKDEAYEMAEKYEHGEAGAVQEAGATPGLFVEKLDSALLALDGANVEQARTELGEAIAIWPAIEGAIATQSADAYRAIETDLGRASALLRQETVDAAAAKALLTQLQTTVAPFTQEQTYHAFDAAAIILREGLEALLVVVALLAFLRRSNNADKGKWIWVGVGAGVLVSLGTAFVLQAVFSRIAAGRNRELVEGITGILAAAMLFYVSYWLHSRSNITVWQRYINERTSRELARGSMFGLATLAFLAVFREGAETTIFYLGMAPSIAFNELILGLGIGSAILIVAAFLMLVVGVRLPLRLFFRVAGLLVYYLGFKFVGAGIHSLQVAGILPTSPVAFLREIPLIGIYPTWETMLPQLLLLLIAVAVYFYLRSLDQRSLMSTSSVKTVNS
ncbi:MAG: FTR1 family protein [Caldilineaceae bacterium]